MYQLIVGIVLLVIHASVCMYIYTGINSGKIQVDKQLILLVIFIPFVGAICVFVLDRQLFMTESKPTAVSVEQLNHYHEDIYQTITVVPTSDMKEVIPLEEALLINDASVKRNIMLEILTDQPESYVDLLYEARLNEDSEVVHYATTVLAEMSKTYDFELQKLENLLSVQPNNPDVIRQYCAFLGGYLRQGLVEGRMEIAQRMQYAQLLRKKMNFDEELDDYAELANNYLALKEYAEFERVLFQMEKLWPNEEATWMLRLNYYVIQKRGNDVQDILTKIKEKNIYISGENKKLIEFWQ